jgi:hypothetical protein
MFITTHKALAVHAESIEPQDVSFLGVHPDAVTSYFDRIEVEDNAAKIICFLKYKGSWAPFELAEFIQYCTRDRGWTMPPAHGKGIFYGLVDPALDDPSSGFRKHGFLQLRADGRIGVTDEFILRCSGMQSATIDALPREPKEAA